MKKKVLIITLSDLRYDARVRRQIEALKDNYAVTVAGFSGQTSNEYKVISLVPTRLTLLRKFIASILLVGRQYIFAHRILHDYRKELRKHLKDKPFDLVIANDAEALPLAFGFNNDAKVLFDAHEYAPRHFEDKFMWRLFFQRFNIWLCRTYIPRTRAMMTVGRRLAEEYHRHFNVLPEVIFNANNYHQLDPTPVESKRIRLVHVGIANPSRKLELMIEMMDQLDSRFTLDLFLLVPGFASKRTKGYINELKNSAAHNERVRIHPPVESKSVVKTLNQFDIGVFLLPPINFNYQNTVPNKLFDFIQARLGVAIGPTPEMAEIVTTYKNGIVASDFTAEALAASLRDLDMDQIKSFKQQSSIAAKELNAERNNEKILKIVRSIIGG